jgi:hypothetical protein
VLKGDEGVHFFHLALRRVQFLAQCRAKLLLFQLALLENQSTVGAKNRTNQNLCLLKGGEGVHHFYLALGRLPAHCRAKRLLFQLTFLENSSKVGAKNQTNQNLCLLKGGEGVHHFYWALGRLPAHCRAKLLLFQLALLTLTGTQLSKTDGNLKHFSRNFKNLQKI